MSSERIRELERQVLSARQDVQQAERAMQEYTRGYHQAKTILAQREAQLATAKQVEADEARPR